LTEIKDSKIEVIGSTMQSRDISPLLNRDISPMANRDISPKANRDIPPSSANNKDSLKRMSIGQITASTFVNQRYS